MCYLYVFVRVDCGLLFLMHSYEGRGVEMGEFRPFMFGRHALEHYQSRQKLGWLMWKDPSFDEVLAMFERDKVFHSLSHFPLGKSLEVSIVCCCIACSRLFMSVLPRGWTLLCVCGPFCVWV